MDKIPRPKAYADKCSLEQLLDWNPEAKWDDLFKKKRVRGWWPVYSDKLGKEYREVKVRGSTSKLVGPLEYADAADVYSCVVWCTGKCPVLLYLL